MNTRPYPATLLGLANELNRIVQTAVREYEAQEKDWSSHFKGTALDPNTPLSQVVVTGRKQKNAN